MIINKRRSVEYYRMKKNSSSEMEVKRMDLEAAAPSGNEIEWKIESRNEEERR